MIEELKKWAKKVSENKKNLDRKMFDDLMIWVINRLEKEGYDNTLNWLDDNYEKGINNNMVGPYILATNSKQIRDKLWGLNRNEKRK